MTNRAQTKRERKQAQEGGEDAQPLASKPQESLRCDADTQDAPSQMPKMKRESAQDELRQRVQEMTDCFNLVSSQRAATMIRFMKETCEKQAKSRDLLRGPEDLIEE